MDAFDKLLGLLSGNKTYLACYLVGLLVSYLLTPWVMKLALRFGVVDEPLHRKVHRAPIPMLGGVVIFLGTWIPLLLLTAFRDNEITHKLAEDSYSRLLMILLAGVAMLAVGLLDDLRGLNAKHKFLVQIPIAIGLVAVGVRFDVLKLPFVGVIDLGAMGPVLSVIWIVGITNALNLIDGIDGLAAGISFFVAATNAIVALVNGNMILALVMWSLSGACLGFLRYNFYPAKIFLGDTGSLFLGVTLAVTAIQASAKGTVATSMLIPVAVLGYPALDTLLAMARRMLRGKSMFTGDRGHIHHRLLARGLDHGKAALVLYGVCVLFCSVAVASVLGSDLWVGIGLLLIGATFLVGIWGLGYLDSFKREKIQQRPLFKVAHLFTRMTMERFEMAGNREELFNMLRDAAGELGVLRIDVRQAPGILGADYKVEWLLDDDSRMGLGLRSEKKCQRWDLKTESYHFDDVGLDIALSFCECKSDERNELCEEFRTLVNELVESAHRRIHHLSGVRSKIQEAVDGN